jgi:hypothetical protein
MTYDIRDTRYDIWDDIRYMIYEIWHTKYGIWNMI